MTRAIIGLIGGVALATLGGIGAQAAGRPAPGVAPAARPMAVPVRADRPWRFDPAAPGHHGFRRGPRWAWGGYPATWLWPDGTGQSLSVIVAPSAPRPVIDRKSFENLRARAGIRQAPTPEPTLYRLEGPRANPAARVIRIAGADEGAARRSRFAHAETGALMLTVPGR